MFSNISSGGLFGTSTQNAPFGVSQPQTGTTNTLFNSSSTGGGVFGRSEGNLFGNTTAPQPTGNSTGGLLFGSTQQPASSSTLFASHASQQQPPSTSLFNAPSAATSGLFSQGGLFGGQQQPSSGSLFGGLTCSASTGTQNITWRDPLDTEAAGQIQTITYLPDVNQTKSIEELRLEDYRLGVGSNTQPFSTSAAGVTASGGTARSTFSGGLFQPSNTPALGSSNIFGLPTSGAGPNPYGQQASSLSLSNQPQTGAGLLGSAIAPKGSTTGTIPTFFGSASTQPSAGGLFSNALPSASGNRFSCVTPASGAGGLFGTSTGQVNVGATGSGGLLQGSGSLFSGLGSVSSTPMFNIFGGSKSGATGLSNTSPSAPGGAEAPKMGTLFGPALTTGSLAPSSTVTQSSSTPGTSIFGSVLSNPAAKQFNSSQGTFTDTLSKSLGTSQNLFGSTAVPTNNSLFGEKQFGASTATSLGPGTSSGLFGRTATQQPSASALGNGSSLFGSGPSSAALASGGGLFGSSTGISSLQTQSGGPASLFASGGQLGHGVESLGNSSGLTGSKALGYNVFGALTNANDPYGLTRLTSLYLNAVPGGGTLAAKHNFSVPHPLAFPASGVLLPQQFRSHKTAFLAQLWRPLPEHTVAYRRQYSQPLPSKRLTYSNVPERKVFTASAGLGADYGWPEYFLHRVLKDEGSVNNLDSNNRLLSVSARRTKLSFQSGQPFGRSLSRLLASERLQSSPARDERSALCSTSRQPARTCRRSVNGSTPASLARHSDRPYFLTTIVTPRTKDTAEQLSDNNTRNPPWLSESATVCSPQANCKQHRAVSESPFPIDNEHCSVAARRSQNSTQIYAKETSGHRSFDLDASRETYGYKSVGHGANHEENTDAHREKQRTASSAVSSTAPCSVRCSREGYSTRPSLESLRSYSDSRLAAVQDFTVIREGFGEITWPGFTDVRGLSVDDTVIIEDKAVEVYPQRGERGSGEGAVPFGTGLNKPAVVTLYNCGPKASRGLSPLTPEEAEAQYDKHVEKMRAFTEKINGQFVALTPDWVWKFCVRHFSRYAFFDDDNEPEARTGESASRGCSNPSIVRTVKKAKTGPGETETQCVAFARHGAPSFADADESKKCKNEIKTVSLRLDSIQKFIERFRPELLVASRFPDFPSCYALLTSSVRKHIHSGFPPVLDVEMPAPLCFTPTSSFVTTCANGGFEKINFREGRFVWLNSTFKAQHCRNGYANPAVKALYVGFLDQVLQLTFDTLGLPLFSDSAQQQYDRYVELQTTLAAHYAQALEKVNGADPQVIKGARYITATWRLVGILYGSLDDELNAVEELDEHREATKCEGVGVSKAHIRVSTERSPLSLSKRDENAGGSSDLMEDNVNNCRTQKCRLELLSDWLSSTNTETVAVALDALDSSSSSSTTNEVHRDSETQLPCEALRRLKRAFYFLMCNDLKSAVNELLGYECGQNRSRSAPFFRLALCLTGTGSPCVTAVPTNREPLFRQLVEWQKRGVYDQIPLPILRLHHVLAGSVDRLVSSETLDWKTLFGLLLWYPSSDAAMYIPKDVTATSDDPKFFVPTNSGYKGGEPALTEEGAADVRKDVLLNPISINRSLPTLRPLQAINRALFVYIKVLLSLPDQKATPLPLPFYCATQRRVLQPQDPLDLQFCLLRLFSGDASLSVYEKLFSPTAMSFSGWDVSLLWPLFRVLPAWAEKNNNPSSAGSETAASFADSALSSLMSRTKSLLNCLMLQQLEEANLWKWCVVLRLTQAAEGDLPDLVAISRVIDILLRNTPSVTAEPLPRDDVVHASLASSYPVQLNYLIADYPIALPSLFVIYVHALQYRSAGRYRCAADQWLDCAFEAREWSKAQSFEPCSVVSNVNDDLEKKQPVSEHESSSEAGKVFAPPLFSKAIRSPLNVILSTCLMSPTSFFCQAIMDLLRSTAFLKGVQQLCSFVNGDSRFVWDALAVYDDCTTRPPSERTSRFFGWRYPTPSSDIQSSFCSTTTNEMFFSDVLERIFRDTVAEQRLMWSPTKLTRRSVVVLCRHLTEEASSFLLDKEWERCPAASLCLFVVWITEVFQFQRRWYSSPRFSGKQEESICSAERSGVVSSTTPCLDKQASSAKYNAEMTKLRFTAKKVYSLVQEQLGQHTTHLQHTSAAAGLTRLSSEKKQKSLMTPTREASVLENGGQLSVIAEQLQKTSFLPSLLADLKHLPEDVLICLLAIRKVVSSCLEACSAKVDLRASLSLPLQGTSLERDYGYGILLAFSTQKM